MHRHLVPRRPLLPSAVGLVLLIVSAVGAVSIPPAGADVVAHGTRIAVRGGGGGRPAAPTTPRYRNCTTTSLAQHLLEPLLALLGRSVDDVPTDDPVAWRSCERIADGQRVGWIIGLDGDGSGGSGTTSGSEAEIHLPRPDVSTSPPRGGIQLVGVPVWFWVDRVGPITATASVPGLSATLTATIASARFEISDGTVLRCADLGTPYDPGRPLAAQRSSCTHLFDDAGPSTVDAIVTWTLSWTSTDGQSGSLPPVERTTRFELGLQEGQAVTG